MTTLMTPAPTIETAPNHIPTGNLAVSLPAISRQDAGVYQVGVLHMGARALLELVGDEAAREPFLRPVVLRDGVPVPLGPLVWSREHHWIPRFERAGDGVQLAGTIFAPPGEKGFVYLLEVASTGPSDVIRLGLEGWWRGVEMTVFTSRTLETQLVVQHDSWTGSLVGEARTGLPLLAWGVQASQDGSLELEGNQFRWTCEVDPTSSPSVRIAFFVAINLEGDGARTGALHLRRRGWEAMLPLARGARAAGAQPGRSTRAQ